MPLQISISSGFTYTNYHYPYNIFKTTTRAATELIFACALMNAASLSAGFFLFPYSTTPGR